MTQPQWIGIVVVSAIAVKICWSMVGRPHGLSEDLDDHGAPADLNRREYVPIAHQQKRMADYEAEGLEYPQHNDAA